MATNPSKFHQFISQHRQLVLVAAIAQIIFLIFIVLSLKNIFTTTYQPANTPIPELSLEIADLPEDSISTIQEFLYDAISSNGGTVANFQDSDVAIRYDTLVNLYFERVDMHYVNFIVDLPNLQQSYQIFHEWSDNNNNSYYLINMATLVMCPTSDQIIYSDFVCHDKFNHQGQNFIVSKFIKYFDFNRFTVSIDDSDYTKAYINPASPSASQADQDSFIKTTKATIASLGISPDIFTYHIVDPTNLTYDNSEF